MDKSFLLERGGSNMNLFKHVIISVGVLFALAGCGVPKGGSRSPKIIGEPKAVEIVEKMKRNGENLKSFVVETTAYREEGNEWKKVITSKIFAKLPLRFREEKQAYAGSDYFGVGAGKKVIVCDGKKIYGHMIEKNKVYVTSGAHLFEEQPTFCQPSKLFFLYSSLSLTPMSGFFDKDVRVEMLGSERIDGKDAYVLRIYPTSKYYELWLKVWVDTERLVPLKAEEYPKSGVSYPRMGSSWEMTFKGYKKVNNIWVPTIAEGTSGWFRVYDMEKRRKYDKIRVTWTNLQINQDIPDSTFKFRIPEGAKVIRTKTR